MSAASYYEPSLQPSEEERLEIEALCIHQTVELLQARLRGFLTRYTINSSTYNRSSAGVKLDTRSVEPEKATRAAQRPISELQSRIQGIFNDRKSVACEEEKAQSCADDDCSNPTAIDANDPKTVISPHPYIKSTPKDESVGKDHDRVCKFPTKSQAVNAFLKNRVSGSRMISPSCAVASGSVENVSDEPVQESASQKYSKDTPWWFESPPESNEHDLCSTCRRINFEMLLHRPNLDLSGNPIFLGNLQSIVEKSGCAFCRLVTHAFTYSFSTFQITLKDIKSEGGSVSCELLGDQHWNRYTTRIRKLCVKFSVTLSGFTRNVVEYAFIQQILNSDTRPPEQSQNDSRIVRDQIDLQLVRRWLETCRKQHMSTRLERVTTYDSLAPETSTNIHHSSEFFSQPCRPAPTIAEAFDITLVDVTRNCLVDMPPETPYMALSYVWGGPQAFQNTREKRRALYSPNSIPVNDEIIPRTIRDAVLLVGQLDEKYIWIDSLCVCQDDTNNKTKQIMNMGNIYSQALVVIVAIAGQSANAGIPGLQPLSRKRAQRAECIQGMILANELAHSHDVMERSVWNTRGWTYQERVLSTKLLIFCETHAFFECNQSVFKEDTGMRNVAIVGSRAMKIRRERRESWNSYRKAVAEYTSRTTSDLSDAVIAFQGIASLLEPIFEGDFLFGLPGTELDYALLWQPSDSLPKGPERPDAFHRRTDPDTQDSLFPSWSWAGWVGRVTYQWSKHQVDDVSRVWWQCTDPQGNVCFHTSDELRASESKDDGRWEFVPNHRGAPYYYQEHRPDVWLLHPVAPKEKRSKYRLLTPGSHQLVFKAYTAQFRILTDHKHPLNFFATRDSLPHLCYIIDRDGFAAGTVYVPQTSVGKIRDRKHHQRQQELICLSRRRYSQFDDGVRPGSFEDDDVKNVPDRAMLYPFKLSAAALEAGFDTVRYNAYKPWHLYNVMLVEWRDGVAFRLALGVVHVTAFVQAKPTLKLITLG